MIACRYRLNFILAVATLLLAITPTLAKAVQWQRLTQTSRHEVALDNHSLRLTNHGRLAVWLRFIPFGERERRQAATEYNYLNYRLHLEFYEVDCSDNSAVMGLTDFIGPDGKVLGRKKGNIQPFAIIPGSVLDKAAQKVCPVIEDDDSDIDTAPDVEETVSKSTESTDQDTLQPTDEARKNISDALQKTVKDPINPEVWIELGNAYYDADKYIQAINAYSKALAFKPGNADVLNDQGAMYRQAGEISKAIDNFEKALVIEPYNLESLYNLGYVYAFDLNKIERALEIWQRYLDLDRSSETAEQVQSFFDRYSKQKE